MYTELHPFRPFLPPQARILFLGSFPPQRKRWCMEFYYPNWTNDFWRIIGLILFEDKDHFCIPAEKRFDEAAIRTFCAEAGLAFYDTASEVRRLRDNASDASLEVVTPTDISALLKQIPGCNDLATTGQKATDLIKDAFGCPVPPVGGRVDIVINGRPLRFWRMPSSSRAYPLPLSRKADFYRELLKIIPVSVYFLVQTLPVEAAIPAEEPDGDCVPG